MNWQYCFKEKWYQTKWNSDEWRQRDQLNCLCMNWRPLRRIWVIQNSNPAPQAIQCMVLNIPAGIQCSSLDVANYIPICIIFILESIDQHHIQHLHPHTNRLHILMGGISTYRKLRIIYIFELLKLCEIMGTNVINLVLNGCRWVLIGGHRTCQLP